MDASISNKFNHNKVAKYNLFELCDLYSDLELILFSYTFCSKMLYISQLLGDFFVKIIHEWIAKQLLFLVLIKFIAKKNLCATKAKPTSAEKLYLVTQYSILTLGK